MAYHGYNAGVARSKRGSAPVPDLYDPLRKDRTAEAETSGRRVTDVPSFQRRLLDNSPMAETHGVSVAAPPSPAGRRVKSEPQYKQLNSGWQQNEPAGQQSPFDSPPPAQPLGSLPARRRQGSPEVRPKLAPVLTSAPAREPSLEEISSPLYQQDSGLILGGVDSRRNTSDYVSPMYGGGGGGGSGGGGASSADRDWSDVHHFQGNAAFDGEKDSSSDSSICSEESSPRGSPSGRSSTPMSPMVPTRRDPERSPGSGPWLPGQPPPPGTQSPRVARIRTVPQVSADSPASPSRVILATKQQLLEVASRGLSSDGLPGRGLPQYDPRQQQPSSRLGAGQDRPYRSSAGGPKLAPDPDGGGYGHSYSGLGPGDVGGSKDYSPGDLPSSSASPPSQRTMRASDDPAAARRKSSEGRSSRKARPSADPASGPGRAKFGAYGAQVVPRSTGPISHAGRPFCAAFFGA